MCIYILKTMFARACDMQRAHVSKSKSLHESRKGQVLEVYEGVSHLEAHVATIVPSSIGASQLMGLWSNFHAQSHVA